MGSERRSFLMSLSRIQKQFKKHAICRQTRSVNTACKIRIAQDGLDSHELAVDNSPLNQTQQGRKRGSTETRLLILSGQLAG